MRACIALLLAALASGPLTGHAQQAIVTMPSADVTDERTFFVMQESQVRLAPPAGFNNTYFFTYGLGWHTELAATLFNAAYPSVNNLTLALGYKTSLPLWRAQTGALEPTFTQGAMLLQSFDGRGTGYWLYGLASIRLPGTRTRLALGVSAATEQLYEKRAVSMMASLEQPLPGKLYLTAEWFSGDHDLSNLIVGLTYHPGNRWLAVLGYKIPTKDRHFTWREQAVVFEIGVFF